jgi:hypothetical protein
VAVDEKEIGPSVVVEIEKPYSPAQPARVDANAARERAILTQAGSAVRVERRRIPGKIRFEDVHGSVSIVITDGDAHP